MAEDLSKLLEQARSGSGQAQAELIRLAYDDLRRLARVQMAGERLDHTLTATALVHEAAAKLLEQSQSPASNRGQFLALAATAMRNLLIDHARGKARQKRGGGKRPLQLDEALVAAEAQAAELIDLHEALERLVLIDQRRSQVVEMRYFGGMSIAETAEALDVSSATVKRDWETARLWLLKELQEDSLDDQGPHD